MGMIGLGSMGMRNLKGFLQEPDCQITAVCDVDASRVQEAVVEVNRTYGDSGCARYRDFRDVIARSDIDLLCLCLPDHWHSIPAILGARAGKDIYGEKPLALTIAEGRAMVEEVRRSSIVWQTGSWQRSTAHFRFACELVRNGRIGKLERIEVGLGVGPTIGPQPPMPVPAGFDYEMWLGPAPWVPYTQRRCHWDFRWILDYSGGQNTDCGAHDIDIAHWGMDVEQTGPLTVEGAGEFPSDGLWDAAVHYKYECHYANGLVLMVGSRNHYPTGVRFIGSRGWVYVNRTLVDAHPRFLLKERFGPDEVHLYSSPPDRQGHRRNFLDCVKSRRPPASTIEVAHRSIAVAHLGHIAMKLGRKLRWNPDTEQLADDPTASRMLGRPMRAPWGF
ncbi:MAG TPA: Gfo/Idh/MocA family oxidoreductase [Candidatus Paceibacterota bacterium]|nr:Gfo/Idh/MocA family oxidoreductase [Candidatus Paceibacterota bacterium]